MIQESPKTWSIRTYFDIFDMLLFYVTRQTKNIPSHVSLKYYLKYLKNIIKNWFLMGQKPFVTF